MKDPANAGDDNVIDLSSYFSKEIEASSRPAIEPHRLDCDFSDEFIEDCKRQLAEEFCSDLFGRLNSPSVR